MKPVTLYLATVSYGGHVFEAAHIMPSLARSILFREIEAFKGGKSAEVNRLADKAVIREIRAGMFVRRDA